MHNIQGYHANTLRTACSVAAHGTIQPLTRVALIAIATTATTTGMTTVSGLPERLSTSRGTRQAQRGIQPWQYRGKTLSPAATVVSHWPRPTPQATRGFDHVR